MRFLFLEGAENLFLLREGPEMCFSFFQTL